MFSAQQRVLPNKGLNPMQHDQQLKMKQGVTEDTESTISDEELLDQYEIMQRQMKRIREEHLGG
jgi:hypothetical protein